MHIPDGFLDAKTFITLDVVAVGFVAAAAARARRVLSERAVPLMAVLAAFIFAAQMLNFPVAGGTSGHFAGGALAAILLGPWAGGLVITLVLVIQALAFGDGGMLALGANVFNLAVVAPFVGYGAYSLLRKVFAGEAGRFVGAFAAAWLAVVAAASACAAELAIAGTVPFAVAFPAMVGAHALIGLGEGVITAAALAAIRASRPDLLELGRGGAA
ncbi:MAG: energy-coupling factor ABC transporter permease [Candidatus Coatesbacteria bacterium]|nr:MAG: energy-coupling factor ABC transporter permease [Candidatus Coatesbacteria bacterium]